MNFVNALTDDKSYQVLADLLAPIPLPKMVKVRQTFDRPQETAIPQSLKNQFTAGNFAAKIQPGMKIAVAVGSRGVAQIPLLVKETVAFLKEQGALPFIVPSMGSHGGATAAGQLEVLHNLGVTEESAGCPIRSSMEVVELGRLENGLPVYLDRYANEADGLVVINRVKPHTAFRGDSESGMVKMITIGLGKQKGAESCHAYSFKYMAEHIVAMAKIVLEKKNVLFAVGTVENAYDEVAKVVVVPPEKLLETDKALLIEAKANMPSLPFKQIDALIIDRIGKDISGDGMDPNITGRYPSPYATGGPEIAKMAVLDLTNRSEGNANGMGTADFTTKRLIDKTNLFATYANGLTSTVVGPTHMPTVLANDLDVLKAAVKTSNARDLTQVRLVRIEDTLHLGEFYISEALIADAKAAGLEILSEPAFFEFNEAGNLF
ncbi:MAG: lactate racemase domain-containing protein [Sporomusaceae bacterium]|nr:lactate racemase domain-containing protein [Sporomusaceae bacterium]